MKYKCLETFSVPRLDDFEGEETGEEFPVFDGSVWESTRDIKDIDDEIELYAEDGSLLILNRELFDLMFEEEEAE
ncbi:hypothetical protein ACORB6_002941 [Listeria monocytogenes]|nr:hypothetical protein [Listeria monocytogenes]EAE1498755.1 hypothetical protein [Listeria monocytogenes]HDI3721970.1 hypothetical protein [Listeria monocytogenes]HDU3385669.1 hypothetical protein [Listeria monocytogenes]